jgi:rare lipoprotein A
MIHIRKKTFIYVKMRTTSVFLILLLLCSCFQMKPATIKGAPHPYKVRGKWYQPISDSKNFSQKGIASWYGKKFHGRKTANGEIYNMHALTAAHKTIPLGTWLHVKNLENGKTVDVRVNDRGPFIQNRIIDLSYNAAIAIGMIGKGTVQVKIKAIPKKQSITIEPLKTKTIYSIQIGSFSDRKNAERYIATLDKTFNNVQIVSVDGAFKVRVGKFSSRKVSNEAETALINAGYPAFTIKE